MGGNSSVGRTRRYGLAFALAVGVAALLGAVSVSRAGTRPPGAGTLAQARALVRQAQLTSHFSSVRATPARPAAASAPTPCGKTPGLLCSTVDVPLDRSGVVPGTIGLHVEVLPAAGTPRGAVFLIAGGPGQGSAHVFDLGAPSSASLFRFLFPGYTLVAYDDRGTGASGLLDCPPLQAALTAEAEQAAATACGTSLGASAPFYSTAQHAEDLESVRQSIAVDRVALFGVSYGTKLSMAYALAHPDHVERLLLDSVLQPEGPDPFEANVLRSMPATLNAFCSDGGCRAATSNFASDVVSVANALAAKPLVGKVLEANGTTRTKKVDGLDLLSTVLDADLNPGLAAELPAVIRAERAGNPQPLLRLAELHDAGEAGSAIELSSALYAATVCRDGPFPWQPDTPPADRTALLQAAIAALPAGSLGPFGTWATKFGNADFCAGWPSPAGGAALGVGPLPNVPVLAVSGGFDMRTPTADANAVAARFPQGRVLVVPGVGHSTVTADPSGCAARAVNAWMTGGAVPTACPRAKAFVVPESALPKPGTQNPARPAGPVPTYTIAAKTIRDAETIWTMTAGFAGGPAQVPGIFGGKIVSSGRTFRLVNYSITRGVSLTGTLKLTGFGPPLAFRGTVTVAGKGATRGVLGVSGTSVRGALGGHVVG